MVQGVRSARGHGSKLALFQPMFAVEFEGLESSRMQMHRFREVRSGIVLQSLPFDVRKSTIALFMAEVLYRLVKECETQPAALRLRLGFGGGTRRAGRGGGQFPPLVPDESEPVSGLFAGQRLPAGGVVRHPRGFVHAAAAVARRGAFGRRRPHPARPVGVATYATFAEIGLNRRQRVAYLDALLVYYGYHLDAIHAVQSVRIFAGGILTNRKPEYSYDEQERFR